MRQRPHARLRLQQLEGRDVPANLTVSFAAGTLTVTGTDDPNQLTITADAADPTHFFLTSTSDTIGGAGGTFATPSGVKNLVLKMKAGNDSVTLAPSPAIKLAGSLTVDGGDGANTVNALNLTVAKNVSIKNGTNAAGSDVISLVNPNVGGGVTVINGDGNTQTELERTAAGLSTVGGHVTITNGTGTDFVDLHDLNVGGNVTVRNGLAAPAGAAGTTVMWNVHNKFRSLIRGSVSVSYLNGTGATGLYDLDIGGNVVVSHGAGGGNVFFDGFQSSLPILIRGNVSVAATGAMSVQPGFGSLGHGAVVGKNFKVTTGAGVDTFNARKLTVNGVTTLALGDGANAVTIDDSLFAGAFNLTTGAGVDTIKLDTTAGTTTVTTFNKAVKMSLGAGVDSVTFGGNTDAFQAIVFAGGCLVRHGAEGELSTRFGKDSYPFGGGLQWVV